MSLIFIWSPKSIMHVFSNYVLLFELDPRFEDQARKSMSKTKREKWSENVAIRFFARLIMLCRNNAFAMHMYENIYIVTGHFFSLKLAVSWIDRRAFPLDLRYAQFAQAHAGCLTVSSQHTINARGVRLLVCWNERKATEIYVWIYTRYSAKSEFARKSLR